MEPAALRHAFGAIDLDLRQNLITCCTTGARAAAWFVLTQLLGRDDVRVHDGSWAEGGKTLDRGDEPCLVVDWQGFADDVRPTA